MRMPRGITTCCPRDGARTRSDAGDFDPGAAEGASAPPANPLKMGSGVMAMVANAASTLQRKAEAGDGGASW